ncbi:hypothetical protein [Clostridium botulinum]|uniref:hypothetical protein n=1 Tax=Clostridium botulinum TaxID=1491 RepID=UPI0004CFEC07|nr:hypothetical protein [Clostridium botulinum]MBY6773689.1 hypothetical protein [Clostridium botulinum]MBY6864269.1 hypothetical protein [Clostridium botulinum]MBY6984852.1 hypothetical protein [Clostridium botulinum]NFP26165.1 hypothetical protein [Clostridium botulinum]
MTNAISKVVAIILAVILTIIVPVYNVYWMIDRTVYNQVGVVTNRFQKEVRTRGYVSKDIYENFMKDLSNTKRSYDVKMLHRKVTYYPLSPTSPKYKPEKPWTIEIYKYNEKTILETIYNKNKPMDYKMNINDDFSVSVEDKSFSGARIFWNFMGKGSNQNSVIFSTYGGVIENEAN